MNCPTCGTLLPDTPDAFCGECGAQLGALAPDSARSLQVEVGSLTNVGITRAEPNQDHIIAVQQPGFGLFAVADGMGGHQCGDVASEVALERLYEVVKERLGQGGERSSVGVTPDAGATLDPDAPALDPAAFLRLAILEAHAAVTRFNQTQGADAGSTLTAALLIGEQIFIGHVGDSRAYQVSEGRLTQITNDHSLVGDLCRKGFLTKEEIYTHPRRSEILQSLGQPGDPPEVELHRLTGTPGLQILLCSDGLWEMVRDPAIEQIITSAPTAAAAAEALIEAANDGGGEDNISAVIIQCLR
ncbi:MAG TPA: protein phosphatase 2C domain-containing protein [Symbiobacteriaceae bacterium]|nr:protein phosphatase 2C domain-containing protein [Symbiobacteriaceae bacterium]